MDSLIVSLLGEMKAYLLKVIGRIETDLDTTTESARLRESNCGNLITDVCRRAYRTDVCMIVGGTIRADEIYPAGDINLQNILDIFPFEDSMVVVKVTGQMLWDVVENGVSAYPKLEGRFPQVSGMRFVYDPSKPSYHRVTKLFVGDQPVNLTQFYTLATR